MQLHAYQSCRSNEGWQVVRIPSESSNLIYTVHVSPWKPAESICECPGYMYRGHCKHLEQAAEKVCRWTDKEKEDQISLGWCPLCGGPTKWEVEVVESCE